MQKRLFGYTQRPVSRLGQGTWNIETSDRTAAVGALRRGIDLGMTHIDTAEMYGSGEAERIAGDAITGRRDEVFLVSKVLPSNASRNGVVSACERSLRNLNTDHLDCYLLHWRGRQPLVDTFAAFEQLRRDGKILAWGVSNFDTGDLDEAWKIAGPGRIACNQVLYHLAERAIEHAVIPWCEERGVAVVAYSPYGSGNFPKPGSIGGRALREVAGARGATVRQVALGYLTRRSGVFTIPKASTTANTTENAGAGDLELSPAEIAQIESAFPLGRRPRSLPML